MTLEDKKDRKRKGERIPPNTFIATDAKKIKLNQSINPGKVVEMGYYHCMENILYDLTFCDLLGINISTPPEDLHAILLGHGTGLLNALQDWKKNKKKRTRKMIEKKKRNRIMKKKKKNIRKEGVENFCFYRRFWETGFH